MGTADRAVAIASSDHDECFTDPRISAYLRQRIDEADCSQLITVTRRFKPELLKGFRPGKEDHQRIRLNLHSQLTKPNGVGVRQNLAIFQEITLRMPLISVLSEEALKHAFTSLSGYFGEVPFIASMLLDERPEVVEFAKAQFDQLNADPIAPHETAKLAAAVQTDLGPFLKVLSGLIDSSAAKGPTSRVSAGTSNTFLQAQPTEARLKQLVRADASYQALQRQVTRGSEQLTKLKSDLQTESKEKTTLQCQVKKLEADLIELNSRIASTVDRRVRDVLNEHLHQLFVPADWPAQVPGSTCKDSPGTANTAGSISPPSILDEARSVLLRQQSIDKRYGMRSVLQAELDDCLHLVQVIEQAARDSLRLLPELPAAKDRLLERADHLKRRLKPARETPKHISSGYQKFIEGLRLISSLDELVDRRRSVEAAELAEAWTESELTDARSQVAETAIRIYMLRGGLHIKDSELAEIQNVSALGALRLAVLRAEPVRLIIDGHNVLHQMKAEWGHLFDGASPRPAARRELIDRVSDLAQATENLIVDLWFDGPAENIFTPAPRVQVNFSGGHGADRADRCIDSHLIYLAAQSQSSTESGGRSVNFVVSADAEVCESARRHGAREMEPREFSLLIHERH